MKNIRKEDENYTGFLEDLEEDQDYRKNVNIYVGKYSASPVCRFGFFTTSGFSRVCNFVEAALPQILTFFFSDGPAVQSQADENEYPTVSLQEMLQDLSIKDDVEMAENS